MSELSTLTKQRDEILAKIREIEETCEGIENKNNTKRIQELNLEQAQLSVQKNEVSSKLSEIQNKLTAIGVEITKLSGTGIDRILDAIKKQRWYFFKNKPKVFMDKNTGLLWANMRYFSGKAADNSFYLYDAAEGVLSNLILDGYNDWSLPSSQELRNVLDGKNFPFLLNGYRAIFVSDINNRAMWVNQNYPRLVDYTVEESLLFPKSKSIVAGTDYENNVSSNNHVYTEKERLQFTLDLFVQNELWPIFDDDEITQIYKKIYFEKPMLIEQLQELQLQIEEIQTVTLISSEFNYTDLLAKYDIKAIDESIIKYYKAIQNWTDELIDKLDYYEQETESVIHNFNLINLKLSKKYENNPNLTDEENALLSERQRYFQKNFSLGMNSVKSKILAVKKQADDIEYRIEEINNRDNAIFELAELEQEKRASFSFIAENTATIIKNALLKIEYFQNNQDFVINAINIWEKWTEDYRVFKTTYKEDLKASCEEDGIEEEIWTKWYNDWKKIRFEIEQKVQPIIERGLKSKIPTEKETDKGIVEKLIDILETYKNSINKFFIEERKGIYQKFVFQAGGELQEKFESESQLYKCTFELQSALQEIIFICKNAEDRVFILKWANSLLDIQIDEILDFVANNDLQKISQTIISEFSALKQKNYEIYLADAKAYSEEKGRREKQYNSLIFKMRKDLMKQ